MIAWPSSPQNRKLAGSLSTKRIFGLDHDGIAPILEHSTLLLARERTPIWLDCDTGHDDAFAILLAARNPRVKLLGISTVYGKASVEHTTYNTRAILKAIGRDDVPVYNGASRPLYRDPPHSPDLGGKTGLDVTTCMPVPTVATRYGDAVSAMNEALIGEPAGRAWLVATGALTNIVKLFTMSPQMADHLAGLSIMGGAFDDGFTDAPSGQVKGESDRFGNITPYAEFNIYCDPEAANSIFANPSLNYKTILVPLDVTHKFLATSEIQIRLLFGPQVSHCSEPTMDNASLVRRLFFEILSRFSETYAKVFSMRSGSPTHDPLAIAAAFAPELFNFTNLLGNSKRAVEERFAVTVITAGDHGISDGVRSSDSQCGRTVIRSVSPPGQGIRIPRAVEAKELWLMLEAALSATEIALGLHASDQWRKNTSADPEVMDPSLTYSPQQQYINSVMADQDRDRVRIDDISAEVERRQYRLASWKRRI